MDNALATLMHATRCAVNHTMQNSPGEIVYQRDMFVDVPVLANLEAIRQRRQLIIDQNVRRQNRKRYDHHYRVGDYVMITKYDPKKGDERLHGSYPIIETKTRPFSKIEPLLYYVVRNKVTVTQLHRRGWAGKKI